MFSVKGHEVELSLCFLQVIRLFHCRNDSFLSDAPAVTVTQHKQIPLIERIHSMNKYNQVIQVLKKIKNTKYIDTWTKQ